MSDGTKISNDGKQWIKLDPEGRKKNYFDNLAKIAETPVPQLLDKVFPPEFKRYTWERAECPRTDKGVFYNTLDGEQGAGDGKIYEWFRATETGEVFRVPYFQGKFKGLTEVFLTIMAKSKELAPWSKVDSILMDNSDMDFTESKTRFGLVGRSAVIRRAGLENTVAALVSDEYSQAERWEIMMDRVAQVTHESVHLNNQDTFMAMGNYRTLVEIGPEVIELLCFAHDGGPSMTEVNQLLDKLGKDEIVNLDPNLEAIGVGIIMLLKEINPKLEMGNIEEIMLAISNFKDRLATSSPENLSDLRVIAMHFALSTDNAAIVERLVAMGATDNRRGILEQIIASNNGVLT